MAVSALYGGCRILPVARARVYCGPTFLQRWVITAGAFIVDSLFYGESDGVGKFTAEYRDETPLLDLYRTAEQVVLKRFPKKSPFRLLIRLEEGQACPLEALITQALSSKIAMKPVFATIGSWRKRAQAGG